jgi:hypothetical protein
MTQRRLVEICFVYDLYNELPKHPHDINSQIAPMICRWSKYDVQVCTVTFSRTFWDPELQILLMTW